LKDLTPSGVNINLDSDIMPMMDEVKTLRDYGHTVLLLHHWGRDGSSDNPFKNSTSIGDAVDVGFSIQNENGTFVLRCFKDRIPVRLSLAFELTDDFGLVEAETPERQQRLCDLKLAYKTIEELVEEKEDVCQKDIVERLKGSISKQRIKELLREGEGRLWNVRQGDRKTLVYSLKDVGDGLESPPDFL
jgi:hypothetical protein